VSVRPAEPDICFETEASELVIAPTGAAGREEPAALDEAPHRLARSGDKRRPTAAATGRALLPAAPPSI